MTFLSIFERNHSVTDISNANQFFSIFIHYGKNLMTQKNTKVNVLNVSFSYTTINIAYTISS